jgi:uncharacterized protein (DUF4415 family)
MRAKKNHSSGWIDPDDAPTLTAKLLRDAELFEGGTLIRRGPGRPRLASPKEAVHLRLDSELVAKLRESGPGWQTRVNGILRAALNL